MKKRKKKSLPSFMRASGKLPYTLKNDYMFHVFLLRNNNLLKHLICSLKHLRPEEVKSVTILNPITEGMTIDNKEYILDIKVLLNDDSVINLEMQVINEDDWPERSLLYLCRIFDELNKGDDYISVKSATHVGILDFSLFQNNPEFYATFRIINEKTNQLYTDKFTMNVLDLTKIELATDEDKKWHIDKWAKLFAAKTWEEIKELAKGDEIMTEAAEAIYKIIQDTEEQNKARGRDDLRRLVNTWNRDKNEALVRIKELEEEKVKSEAERKLDKERIKRAEVERKQAEAEKQKAEAEIEHLRKLLKEKESN